MKAFYKTIVGDSRNLGIVAALVGIEFLLARADQILLGSLLIPALALASVAWLATR